MPARGCAKRLWTSLHHHHHHICCHFQVKLSLFMMQVFSHCPTTAEQVEKQVLGKSGMSRTNIRLWIYVSFSLSNVKNNLKWNWWLVNALKFGRKVAFLWMKFSNAFLERSFFLSVWIDNKTSLVQAMACHWTTGSEDIFKANFSHGH